jgi:hypothetical protein
MLNLDKNSNPQFINLLLTYPTRVIIIVAEQVEVYGMEGNLNPQSSMHVQHMQLKTKSFLK